MPSKPSKPPARAGKPASKPAPKPAPAGFSFDDPCYGTATAAMKSAVGLYAAAMLPNHANVKLERFEPAPGLACWKPSGTQPVNVVDARNGYAGTMSPEAAGLVITGMALSHLILRGKREQIDPTQLLAPANRLHALVQQHPQRQQIHDAWYTRAPGTGRDPEWERISRWTPSTAHTQPGA